MESICDYKVCTACGLCVAKCPTHSIEMRKGKLGHLYPEINQTTCVDCSLCVKSCPSLHHPAGQAPSKAYAAFAIDRDDYISSTSGAAASLFSRYIINEGGVVYGCAVCPSDGTIDISHIRIDSPAELFRLKGSKYVQSRITDILLSLKKDVSSGKPVLFIGVPCQVAAVKKIMSGDPDNLYLVDLICHGVPSLAFLQEHITKVLKGAPVDNVKFRDEAGAYILQLSYQGKERYKSALFSERYQDAYINSFFDGYSFRDSCYNCNYACPERISDLTIGDFWGLGKLEPTEQIPEHKHGISVLLPVTSKGNQLVSAIRDNAYITERPVLEAIQGNDQLSHPKQKSQLAGLFRSLQPCLGYQLSYRFVSFFTKTRIKIGLIKKNLLRS